MADPALASDSDPAIIARVLGGAHSAFEILVRRHNQRLLRAARAILRSDVEAEDVLQQTWLEVYRHLGQFRGDSQFTTWATRIAVNAALAHARKQPVIAEVVDEPDGHTPDEVVENTARAPPSPRRSSTASTTSTSSTVPAAIGSRGRSWLDCRDMPGACGSSRASRSSHAVIRRHRR